MSPYRDIPTRGKVIFVAVIASLFTLGLVVLAVIAYRAKSVEHRTTREVTDTIDGLVAVAHTALLSNDVSAAQSALTNLNANATIQSACIYNRDGAIIAKYLRSGSADDDFPMAEPDSQRFENHGLIAFRSVNRSNEVIGHVFLRADLDSYFITLPNRTGLFVAVASLVFILAVAFAVQLQRMVAQRAIETELIPLVPPGAEVSEQLSEIHPDEFRLLNKKVDVISGKLQKIEKRLAKQTKEPKERATKSIPQPIVATAKEELACSLLDLNAVTNNVVKNLAAEIEQRSAEVAIQNNLPFVWANKSAIEQVITNLVSNALKFCPPGTKPRIRVGGCVNGNAVRLWVHDNGVGIAPENQNRIFTSTDSGFGLAAVKQNVEQMRGQVGFDSAAGHGSTFWIELPKSEPVTLN